MGYFFFSSIKIHLDLQWILGFFAPSRCETYHTLTEITGKYRTLDALICTKEEDFFFGAIAWSFRRGFSTPSHCSFATADLPPALVLVIFGLAFSFHTLTWNLGISYFLVLMMHTVGVRNASTLFIKNCYQQTISRIVIQPCGMYTPYDKQKKMEISSLHAHTVTRSLTNAVASRRIQLHGT